MAFCSGVIAEAAIPLRGVIVVDREHAPTLSQSALMVDRARARLRLGRKLIVLAAAAAALCVVVVLHRDATHVEKACESLNPHIVSLQRLLDANGALPADYVGSARDSEIAALRYAEPEIIRWASTVDEPVIIGCGPPVSLILANGYGVVIFEGGKLRVGWRSSSELRDILADQKRRAAATLASP